MGHHRAIHRRERFAVAQVLGRGAMRRGGVCEGKLADSDVTKSLPDSNSGQTRGSREMRLSKVQYGQKNGRKQTKTR